MTDEEKQKLEVLLVGALAVSALLISASVLWATISMGATIVSSTMLVIFQVVLTVASVALSGAFVIWIGGVLWSRFITEIDSLRRQHADLLRKLSKRTPAFTSATALIATLVLLVADKVFCDVQWTVCAGLILTLLFYVSNELQISDSGVMRVLGGGIWVVAVLGLPIAVVAENGWSPDKVISRLSELKVTTLVLVIAAVLIASLVPYARGDDG